MRTPGQHANATMSYAARAIVRDENTPTQYAY
jgi:hypothetical protein